jgi:hypothetical protein
MTTVKITMEDSLPLFELKTVLSLIRGITRVEVAESYIDTEQQEYEQLKTAFLNSSKRSMSQQINKYIA